MILLYFSAFLSAIYRAPVHELCKYRSQRSGGVRCQKTPDYHVREPHSVCDRTCRRCLLLWQSLSWLAILVAVDHLRACMLRFVDGMVDSISFSSRAKACRMVSRD